MGRKYSESHMICKMHQKNWLFSHFSWLHTFVERFYLFLKFWWMNLTTSCLDSAHLFRENWFHLIWEFWARREHVYYSRLQELYLCFMNLSEAAAAGNIHGTVDYQLNKTFNDMNNDNVYDTSYLIWNGLNSFINQSKKFNINKWWNQFAGKCQFRISLQNTCKAFISTFKVNFEIIW